MNSAKIMQKDQLVHIDADEQQEDVNLVNSNLVETHIRLLGDRTTISQIIQLLAYVRHAIQNNMKTNIDVKIGQYVANTPLVMDVNDQEIKDLISQPSIEIN